LKKKKKPATILVDMIHFPNVNFLKPAIRILSEKGYRIIITTQRRGRLPEIVKKELPGYKVITFGRHKGTRLSIIFEANLLRFFYMVYYIIKFRPKMGLAVTSFPLEIAMGLFHKPNIHFEDDIERKYNFIFHNLFATRVFLPPIFTPRGKYGIFNALKEWSYLSPSYFSPDSTALIPYGLHKKKYIFIREVSTGSFNYMAQSPHSIASFAKEIPSTVKVVLSLENKKHREFYPENWIILEEPVNDIHSLMYFSSAVISSGDSMAREGGLLGVPSIYCGVREMRANNMLITEGIMYKIPPVEVPSFLNILVNRDQQPDQEQFRSYLREKWDDVTRLIVSNCVNYIK
jgi:uncharacterized protein